jgi:hypothetical protein
MSLISEKELTKYGKTYSLSKMAIALVNQQKATWELASVNYRSLRKVQTRSFDFGHFRIDCQYNPERIRSSAADTNREAILSRPCFLCDENLPPVQFGVAFGNEYFILTNPYPIFPFHLTIPYHLHTPQQIAGNLDAMLQLSYALSDFTVFYNGPRCGASAPDHLHFQAGSRDSLPIEEELELLLQNHSDLLTDNGTIRIYAVENYLRRFICFRCGDKELLIRQINKVIDLLHSDGTEEPMMNILTWYHPSGWSVVLFPRSLQRPREYYANDFDRLIISPAAAELGGLVILPREEDFYKLTEKDLVSVFGQVTIQKNVFNELKQRIADSNIL